MSDAFNHARRNAQAFAARQRHAGPHNPGTRRPDVFDRINSYTDAETAELVDRQSFRSFDIASDVRVSVPGPFHGEQGRVVTREMNEDGFLIFGVSFNYGERQAPVYFLANELEVAND